MRPRELRIDAFWCVVKEDEFAVTRIASDDVVLAGRRIVDDRTDAAAEFAPGPWIGPRRAFGFDDDGTEQSACEKVRVLVLPGVPSCVVPGSRGRVVVPVLVPRESAIGSSGHPAFDSGSALEGLIRPVTEEVRSHVCRFPSVLCPLARCDSRIGVVSDGHPIGFSHIVRKRRLVNRRVPVEMVDELDLDRLTFVRANHQWLDDRRVLPLPLFQQGMRVVERFAVGRTDGL